MLHGHKQAGGSEYLEPMLLIRTDIIEIGCNVQEHISMLYVQHVPVLLHL